MFHVAIGVPGVDAVIGARDVEVPDQSAHYKSHLQVRQPEREIQCQPRSFYHTDMICLILLFANATPRSKRKGSARRTPVVQELAPFKPPLWLKSICIGKVFFVVMGTPRAHRDGSLHTVLSAWCSRSKDRQTYTFGYEVPINHVATRWNLSQETNWSRREDPQILFDTGAQVGQVLHDL